MTTGPRLEELLRELAPPVLGALARRYGQFDAGEDAVQEALVAAAQQWPEHGVPESPRGWLLTVPSRRIINAMRGESARRRREATVAAAAPKALVAPAADAIAPDRDDTLTLLFLCCHPALSPASQIAITLRAVGGLTTGQIARAFLVPEATMAQRISRAKQSIRAAGATFGMPPPEERSERLRSVLRVLYLIFNEGYTATSGPDLQRPDLTREAIRLARDLHRLLPDEGEVAGLLALMLLPMRAVRRARGRMAAWSRWPSRTAACGMQRRSPRGWRSSPRRCRARRSVATSSRRRSPPSTTRPPPQPRRTGRRSSSSTSCSGGSGRTRWSR